ncbi:hypothetical protein B4N89_29880 [Embleya scabrispora]|uniref:Uncharacterized protein n=1 Tax=Embleya scabrispora TaxID=159449 RepID=A0A1T3P697_9ACTN|nr:hypothetical protein [Embleya scabrispora]OPC84573.1 hypothetical protein B4N89_29880 [Embleya scabrispora]
MTLVRHLVAPASGRIAAANDPLFFDLAVNPDPLRVSPSEGTPGFGDLIFITSLAEPRTIEVRGFEVAFRVGDAEADLALDVRDLQTRISLAGWTGTTTTASGRCTTVFAPASDEPPHTAFDASTGVTFQAVGLSVNRLVGSSVVTVSASWRATGSTAWQTQTTEIQVGKYPLGFHLRSLVAEPLSVDPGGGTTLRWDASAATHVSLMYNGHEFPVGDRQSIEVGGLTETTTFHLNARAQSGSGFVERTLSITVYVFDPQRLAGRVVVEGTLRAGALEPSDPTEPIVVPQGMPLSPAWAYEPVTGTLSDSTWPWYGYSAQRPASASGHEGTVIATQTDATELLWSTYDGYGWPRRDRHRARGRDAAITRYGTAIVWIFRHPQWDQFLHRRLDRDLSWSEIHGPSDYQRDKTLPGVAANQGERLTYLFHHSGTTNVHYSNVPGGGGTVRALSGTNGVDGVAFAEFGNLRVGVYRLKTTGHLRAEVDNAPPDSASAWWTVKTVMSSVAVTGTPALAELAGHLYCVCREQGSRTLYMARFDGELWSAGVPVMDDWPLDRSPGLIALHNRLFIV